MVTVAGATAERANSSIGGGKKAAGELRRAPGDRGGGDEGGGGITEKKGNRKTAKIAEARKGVMKS